LKELAKKDKKKDSRQGGQEGLSGRRPSVRARRQRPRLYCLIYLGFFHFSSQGDLRSYRLSKHGQQGRFHPASFLW
jgi:hypothetical protein